MDCPNCGRPSPEDAAFCSRCGAPLGERCATCGRPNPAGAAFCTGCGTRSPPGGPPRSLQQTGERRHLTVMFCDLVDSTRLAGELDPEDMRDVVVAYQRACAGAIAEHSGFLARYLGDGVLAYFGFPEAHEDDARLAVAAGLAVVDAVGPSARASAATTSRPDRSAHRRGGGDRRRRRGEPAAARDRRRDPEPRGAPAIRRLARNRRDQRPHARPRGGLLRGRQHRRADAEGHPPPGVRVPRVAPDGGPTPARRGRDARAHAVRRA